MFATQIFLFQIIGILSINHSLANCSLLEAKIPLASSILAMFNNILGREKALRNQLC